MAKKSDYQKMLDKILVEKMFYDKQQESIVSDVRKIEDVINNNESYEDILKKYKSVNDRKKKIKEIKEEKDMFYNAKK